MADLESGWYWIRLRLGDDPRWQPAEYCSDEDIGPLWWMTGWEAPLVSGDIDFDELEVGPRIEPPSEEVSS